MIVKLISLPFVIIRRILGLITGILKLIACMGFGTFKLIFNHALGTVFGALVGFFLGKKHVGIKLFTRKKKIRKISFQE